MRTLVFSFCVFSCAILHAAPFTWDGGSITDNNWMTGDNWNGNAAPANDGTASLVFVGTSRTSANNNCGDDIIFTGINFANDRSSGKDAGFTLSGDRIILGGDISATEPTVNGAITDTLSLPILLNGTRTITANQSGSGNDVKAHHLILSGVIAETGGSYGLIKSGGANLTLNGMNTYTGPTTLGGGRVYFNSIANVGQACSFGAPTTQENATLFLSGGSIEYTGGDASTDRDFWFQSDLQFSIGGTGTLTLNGGIGGPRGPLFRGGRDVIINGPVTNAWSFGRTDGGTVSLNCLTNTFPGDLTISDGWIVVPAIADSGVTSPIGKGNRIIFGQAAYETNGRLRYTGAANATCNRTLHINSSRCAEGGRIEISDSNATATFSGAVTSTLGTKPVLNPVTDTAVPLWLSGAGSGILTADLPVGLRIIKEGTGTWTLTGANSYTGATTVTTGTLILNGSTAAASAVTVNIGATLGGTGTVHGALSVSGGTLAPGNAGAPGTLTAATAAFNSGRIVLDLQNAADGPSDMIAVIGRADFTGLPALALNLPPAGLQPGAYTLITYANCTGALALDQVYPNVTLTVGATNVTLNVFGAGTVTELTWLGSESSAWDFATANWDPATILFSDTLNVVFNDTGISTNVAIPAPVAPSIVTVAATNNHYTFAATGIGTAGLSVSAALVKSGPASLTLEGLHNHVSATVIDQGTLHLTNGTLAASSVSISTGAHLEQAADSVIAGESVQLTIQGTAALRGANTYGGETRVGALGWSNRNTTVYHNLALGSTAGGTTVIGGHGNYHNSLLLAPGVTVTGETLTITGNGRASLAFNSPGEATWDGDIIAATGSSYINCNQRDSTFYIGTPGTAATISGGNQMQFRESGTIILNSRLNIPGQQIIHDNDGTLIINSTNNLTSRLRISEGTVRLGADNALPASTILDMGKSDANYGNKAYFDLNGHSQTIAGIIELHHHPFPFADAGRQHITSDLPAILTVDLPAGPDVTFTNRGSEIRGAVTLVKDGPGTLVLGQTNLTSGAFIVSNGVLRLSTGSTGPDCTNVTVTAGALQLQNPDALMPAANVTFPDGSTGTIDISANVNVTVGTLWFGESQKRAGTWGAPGSGAQHTHARFTGAGTLTVLHDTSGTLLMIQ